MRRDYRRLISGIESSLSDQARGDALLRAVKRGRDSRRSRYSQLPDPTSFIKEVSNLKTAAVRNMDELVSRFAEKCRENGADVFMAETGSQVIDYVEQLAARTGSKLIAKSKSLTTEEIEFNRHLESRGIEVVETDLGERIIQLAGHKPYHLVFPAIHMSQSSIAELFTGKFGYAVQDNLEDIMETIRKELRPVFFTADIGVNGANIGVAETGTVVIETNEGNDRLANELPRIQVVVIGMEKIVASWDDAVKLITAHPMSATGTRLTNYVSMISGRLDLEGGGAREMHVVILDNGRSRMKSDPDFAEALNCIRCGACMNICPTYGVVGGHVFGHIYPGPIGIPWTEEIHGLGNSKFAHLCIFCGLCQTVCPAGIDIPMMIAKVKEKDVNENGQLAVNRFMCTTERLSKLLSMTAPLSNWLVGNWASRLVADRFLGLDRTRAIPLYTRQSFSRRFSTTRKRDEGNREIVYFPDMFANYVRPEIGLGAVKLLESTGASVISPKHLRPSGAPLVLYGELAKARKVAMRNIQVLHPLVSDGCEVIVTEPTATYCLKHVYPALLDHSEESELVASHVRELFEYIESEHHEKVFVKSAAAERINEVGFHIPCHERPLSAGKHAMRALERSGFTVRVIETGTCCGMAGTFGLKKGPLGADLSRRVAKPLIEMFNADSAIDAVATESSICTMQLHEGVRVPIFHPVELLAA